MLEDSLIRARLAAEGALAEAAVVHITLARVEAAVIQITLARAEAAVILLTHAVVRSASLEAMLRLLEVSRSRT